MEDALRSSIDATPAMLWSTDPDGSVDFLNQRCLDYAGLTLEVAKTQWLSAVHPDDRPGFFAHWRDLLATGRPGDYEARIRRSDGVYRWFIFRAAPHRDESGKIVKWFGQNVDIEDRRRAEDLLAGSNRLLEMVARGEPVAKVLIALCLVVEELAPGSICALLHVDPASQRLTRGAAPSLPAGFIDQLNARPPGTDASPYAMAAAKNEQVICEDCALETRWISWRDVALAHGHRAVWSTPVVSHDGQVLGTIALHWKEPATPTPLHQALIQQFAAIASIALEERNRQENALPPTFELMRARVHPDDPELLEQGLACANRGEDFPLEFRLQIATLGELTASIAHEVNQPLAGIVNNTSTLLRLLAEQTPPLDEVRAAAMRTLRDANRAADMIARLREFFRKQSSTAARVDLSRAARDVLALMRAELQQNQILVRTAFSSELPTIVGDRVQLQQVLLNLIVNAIEAMSGVNDGQRLLEIRSQSLEGHVCLSVRDNGIGISRADAERMFDSFYTSKTAGTGIGLSISRSIVEAHRGKLWMTPNDGPGVTLFLSLPIASPGRDQG